MLVKAGAHAFCTRPIIELHDFGVHFQPVANLVFRGENWPVIREGQVRHMVVPDRVVQAQRLVATAPLIARTLSLVDDQGWHAHSLEPRSEPQSPLAAAHDQAIGLGGDT
ncbi:hypothetical protein D3C81_1189240 [compost metagenome]